MLAIPPSLLLPYLAGMQEDMHISWWGSESLDAQVSRSGDTGLSCVGCLLECCPSKNVNSGKLIPLLAKNVIPPSSL